PVIIGALPYGRCLAPNSSILLYSLLFSSSSQRNLPSAPLAYQSLVCPSASCSPFYPPSLILTVLLAKHVQSNYFFAVQSSPLIFDFLLRSQAPSRLSSYPPSSLSPIFSKASKRLISSFLKVHVSDPYKATLQTIVFIVIFLRLIYSFSLLYIFISCYMYS